jgi:hypothetical protein
MFKANDTVFIKQIGGVSGRVVSYNPYTNVILILHRLKHNSWHVMKYNAEYVRKSEYPLSWDMNTPFVTPKPTFISRALSFLLG